MMVLELQLTQAEARALTDALDAYLPALAEEAARTDRVADAHALWDQFRALQAIRAHLDTAVAVSPAGAP